MDSSFKTVITMGDEESPGYSISLEEIDLNMLPIFSWRRNDKTVPLWSSASSGPGAEYYEFEVLVDEGGDSDDERLENATGTLCHICAVSVPAAHWQRHAHSAAHRASRAIADTSLQRARQMALSPPAVSAHSPLPGTYFCPPCSTAVALSKRNTHEHSERHSASILYGKLLTSLANLYENKDNLDNACEDILRAITNHKEERDGDTISTSTSEGSVTIKTDTKTTEEMDYTIHTKSGAKLKVSFDNYHGFYTCDDTTLCRVCRVLVEDKNEHQLMAEHRTRVEVAVKDKHCIRQLTNVLSHCMLCNDLIGNSDEAHITSEQHNILLQAALIQNDIIPKTEDSYTKEVRTENYIETVEFNQQNYFCQVCQIYIFKSSLMEHVGIDAHKNGLGSYRMRNRIKAPAIQKISSYCDVCKVNIGGKKASKRHNSSNDHKFNEWLVEKDTKLHYHFRPSGFMNEVVCKICNVQYPAKTVVINEHVNSFNHQTNYKKILKDNCMKITGEYDVDCVLCNRKFYMIQVLDHIESRSHNKKLKSCSVIGLGLEEISLMREENQESYKNAKLKEILQGHRIYNYKDERYYECRICYLCVKKSEILKHILSKKHIHYFGQVLSQNTKKTTPKDVSLNPENVHKAATLTALNSNEGHKVNSPEYMEITKKQEIEVKDDGKHQLEETELKLALETNQIENHNDSSYWCKACKRLVSKSALNIMHHIDSWFHKQYLSELQTITHNALEEEAIKEEATTSNDKNIPTETTNDTDSINEVEKQRKLEYDWIEKRQKEYYCEACEVNLVLGYEDTHIALESHVSNLAKIHKLSATEVLKKGSEYYCCVCLESIQRGLENIHIESQTHKTNIDKKEYLESNRVFSIGMNYFCEICLVSVKRGCGEDHINSAEHRIKFKNEPNANIVPTNVNTTNVDQTESANTVNQTETANKTNADGTESAKTTDQARLRLQKRTNTLHYLFDWTIDTEELKVACLVCNTNLSFHDVMSHRKSKSHKDTYKDLLDANTMFRIRHRCFCECCREIMKVNQEYVHLTSDRHSCNLARNTERLNQSALKELSLKMFYEDIAAEKRLKSQERYNRTNFGDDESDDYGETRSDIIDTFVFLNSLVDSDEDNSVSDSDVSFMSAETNVAELDEPKNTENSEINTKAETQSQEDVKEVVSLADFSFVSAETSVVELDQTKHIEESEIDAKETQSQEHVKAVVPLADFSFVSAETSVAEVGQTKNIEKSKLNAKEETQSQEDVKDVMVVADYIFVLAETSVAQLNETKNVENSKVIAEKETQSQDVKETVLPTDFRNIAHLFEETNNCMALFCRLCQCAVGNRSDLILEHVEGVKHTKQYESVLRINNFKEIMDISSETIQKYFCKSCGIDVAKSDLFVHINSEKHKIYLTTQPSTSRCLQQSNEIKPVSATDKEKEIKMSSLSDIADSKPPDAANNAIKSEYICKVCNVVVPNNPNNIKMHDDGGRHKNNLKFLEKPTPEIQIQNKIVLTLPKEKSKPETKQSNQTQILPTAPAGARNNLPTSIPAIKNYVENGLCLVCKITVPDNKPSIIEHLKGREHNKNVKALEINASKINSSENIKQKQDSKQNLPGTITPDTGYASTNKVNKITTSSSISNVLESDIDTYIKNGHCNLCNAEVGNNIPHLKEHVKGKNHQQELKSFLANNKTSRNIIQKNHEVYQNLPGVSAPSQNNTTKAEANKVKEINIPIIVGAEAKLNNIDTYIKGGYCYLCEMKIPNNISNIKDHANGKNHKQNVESLKAKIKGNVAQTLNLQSQPIHIIQKNHEVYQNLPGVSAPSQKNTTKAEANKVKEINIPIIVGAEAKLNNIDIYIKGGYCYLCEMKIPNNISNIKDHANGKNHKQNLESLKAKIKGNVAQTLNLQSQPILISTTYACHVCNVEVPNTANNIKEHVEGTRHKDNVELLKARINTTLNNDQDVVVNNSSDITNVRTNSSSSSVSKLCDMEVKKKKRRKRNKKQRNYENNDQEITVKADIRENSDKLVGVLNTKEIKLDSTKSSHVISIDDSEISKTGPNVSTSVSSMKNNDVKSENTETNTSKGVDGRSNNDSKGVNTSTSDTDHTETNTTTLRPVDSNCKTENDDQETDDSDEGFYICKVCERTIPDNETEIKSHLNSFRHNTNLKEKKIEQGMLLYTETRCDICEEAVLNNPIATKKHAESELHKSKFARLLSKNQIKIRDDKVCYCEVCDLYFSKFSVSSHIKRSKHVTQLGYKNL